MVLEFGDVTILLGANGAGKSNLISFFKMLSVMMQGNLQQFVAEAGTNQKFLHYGPKRTPENLLCALSQVERSGRRLFFLALVGNTRPTYCKFRDSQSES